MKPNGSFAGGRGERHGGELAEELQHSVKLAIKTAAATLALPSPSVYSIGLCWICHQPDLLNWKGALRHRQAKPVLGLHLRPRVD